MAAGGTARICLRTSRGHGSGRIGCRRRIRTLDSCYRFSLKQELPRRQYIPAVANALLAAAAILTIVMAVRTYWYLFASLTNVPYPDHWDMLDEIRRARSGEFGWNYLWSPYWGHRPLWPRLLTLFAAAHLHFAMVPFAVISVAFQVAMVLTLVMVASRLMPDHGRLFWLSVIVTAHLMLSSLQLEVFVKGVGVMYTAGYTAVMMGIVVLAGGVGGRLRVETRALIAAGLGIISVGSIAIGLFGWPVFVLEAWLAGAGRKLLAFLTAGGLLIAAFYSIGWQRGPGMGMGLAGIIRHPLGAAGTAAFVLGGPIGLYAPWAAVCVGAAGLLAAGSIAVHMIRKRAAEPAELAFMMVLVFLLGSDAGLVAGRLGPEVLSGGTGQPVSRYMGPVFTFWAVLFALALSSRRAGRTARLRLAAVSLVVFILTFGMWNLEWRMSRAWAAVSESYDAMGSGFLMGVSDQEFMSQIITIEPYRNRMIAYMRAQHLSVFAEPRASWLDQNVRTIALPARRISCRAAISRVPLGGDPPAYRVTGTLMLDGYSSSRPIDLLFTDDKGIVKGLARTLPAGSKGATAVEILGYTRSAASGNARLFALPGGRLCGCRL